MKLKKIFIVCFLLSLNFLNVSCEKRLIDDEIRIPTNEQRIIEAKNRYNNIVNCAFQERPVISVSGIYDKKAKKKDRLESFSTRVFNIKSPKFLSFSEAFMEPQNEEADYINIELIRKGHLDQAMLFPRSSHIEVFYEGGIELKEVESVAIFTAFFPICVSFNKDDYRVSVKEVYIKGGVKKEELLIDSAPLTEEEFEYYTMPSEIMTRRNYGRHYRRTEEQTFETAQPDTTQPDIAQSDASNTSQSDVFETTQPDNVEIESDFPLIP